MSILVATEGAGMIAVPPRARASILLALLLVSCSVGQFIDDVFKQHPPSPLQQAQVSSDARLDSSGAIVGSFVGEGTTRGVHLISSDTGLIAALVRQYRPLRDRQGNVWGWLNEQRSYTIEVKTTDPNHLRPATALVGSPDGHTSVSLRSVILHGSSCGWRGRGPNS
jgi:hypothetical protein